jgi:putative aminopeptidase FrvX
MRELITQLTAVYGPSGREGSVADLIESLVKDKVDSVRRDALGNLICEKKGTGNKRIMFAAHMDHIGLIVTHAEKEGFLRVSNVGAININHSRARRVKFPCGAEGVLYEQALKENEKSALSTLYIDIGAKDAEEALSMVEIGDVAVYAEPAFAVGEHRLASPAMDDRAACALLIGLLNNLPEKHPTIAAVFTAQEEVGLRGATVSAYSVQPDEGIALDVTPAGDIPELKLNAVKMGEGPAVKIKDARSISNPGVVRRMLDAAKAAGVPCQREVLPYGGTDAGAMQLSRGGMPVGTLSIPCRYVHSACEMIDLRDMENALKLLVEYVKAP